MTKHDLAPDARQPQIDHVLAFVPDPERHKWFRRMNSSQALAQSVLGHPAAYRLLDSLAELHDGEGRVLFGEAEHLSEQSAREVKVEYLHEPQPTSLDGYIGGAYRVARVKCTEREVGSCSQPGLKPTAGNYETSFRGGIYTWQRPSTGRCALAEAPTGNLGTSRRGGPA